MKRPHARLMHACSLVCFPSRLMPHCVNRCVYLLCSESCFSCMLDVRSKSHDRVCVCYINRNHISHRIASHRIPSHHQKSSANKTDAVSRDVGHPAVLKRVWSRPVLRSLRIQTNASLSFVRNLFDAENNPVVFLHVSRF